MKKPAMGLLASLAAITGLMAVSCATTAEADGPRSAEEHDAQARLATTARDHAMHLRQAADLRRKEASTCAPVAEPHEGHKPLVVSGEIASAEPEYQNVNLWRRVLRGASFVVIRGALVDSELAKKAIACHLAQAATHGWAGPGADRCPFCVPGATAEVAAASTGTRIAVRCRGKEGAGEILRRTRALLTKSDTTK